MACRRPEVNHTKPLDVLWPIMQDIQICWTSLSRGPINHLGRDFAPASTHSEIARSLSSRHQATNPRIRSINRFPLIIILVHQGIHLSRWVFDSPQQGIEAVYGWSCNICAAPWNKKAHLSRVNDVRSNGVSHPAMAPSTNSCKYKKMHHCKFAHNQQLETPNSHHSTGCPVNPLSFHQKHKAWLHRQQLRTKVEGSHRGCGMLSTPWTVFDGCKLKHHRCSNLCTNTNVLKAVGIICHLGVLPTCLGGLVCSVFLRFCLLF